MRYTVTLELEPMSTNRANIIVHPKGSTRPMVMKSTEARAWMRAARVRLELWRNVHRVPCIKQPVSVSIDVYRKSDAGDLDNYAKGLLDALQEAKVLRDDKQVVELHMRKFVDRRRPRYEVVVEVIGGSAPMFELDPGA
jgi:Holliday junction resolvase RusA-like endonuclease